MNREPLYITAEKEALRRLRIQNRIKMAFADALAIATFETIEGRKSTEAERREISPRFEHRAKRKERTKVRVQAILNVDLTFLDEE
jgi:hypothetical protein